MDLQEINGYLLNLRLQDKNAGLWPLDHFTSFWFGAWKASNKTSSTENYFPYLPQNRAAEDNLRAAVASRATAVPRRTTGGHSIQKDFNQAAHLARTNGPRNVLLTPGSSQSCSFPTVWVGVKDATSWAKMNLVWPRIVKWQLCVLSVASLQREEWPPYRLFGGAQSLPTLINASRKFYYLCKSRKGEREGDTERERDRRWVRGKDRKRERDRKSDDRRQ